MLSLVLVGCMGIDQKQSYDNFLSSIWSQEELENIEYAIIIPHQGCSGCITYAEDFYLKHKNKNKLKFIFTHIISLKNLKNRLKIDIENSYIDKDNKLLSIGEPDKNIYPCILQIKNGNVYNISYQSPYEDGFGLVEKYLLSSSK